MQLRPICSDVLANQERTMSKTRAKCAHTNECINIFHARRGTMFTTCFRAYLHRSVCREMRESSLENEFIISMCIKC